MTSPSTRGASTTTGRWAPRSPSFARCALASLELLESLTPAEWNRTGTHTESGPYSVDDWLRIYATHSHDHARQIREARDASRS